MKSSLYYFPYWFPVIITQITVDKKKKEPEPVKCLWYFTWSYCKQLASNVKLAKGKYKIISRQLSSFEVLYSRPAKVSVAVGDR
jgi:hypothetical protein